MVLYMALKSEIAKFFYPARLGNSVIQYTDFTDIMVTYEN
jgi:hypothetical protein